MALQSRWAPPSPSTTNRKASCWRGKRTMAAETRWSPSDLAADMKQPSCALVGVRGIKVREIEVPAAAPRQVDSAVATLAPPATLLQVGEGSLTVGLPVEGSVVAAARTVVQVVAEVVV